MNVKWTREGKGYDVQYVGRVDETIIARIYRGGDRYYPWSVNMPGHRIGNSETLGAAKLNVERAFAGKEGSTGKPHLTGPLSPGPGKPATFVAPELPTRAEREFEREFDAMEMHFRERQFVKMLDNAQRLVLMAQRLAIFGRQGIDAIPVDENRDEDMARLLAATRQEGIDYAAMLERAKLAGWGVPDDEAPNTHGPDCGPRCRRDHRAENAARWDAQPGRMAGKLGLDNPAGAGDDVEASRG